MMYKGPEEAFLETGIIAIMRGIEGDSLIKMVDALYEGGVRLAEVTLNTPSALSAIRELRSRFDGKMFIGAGTVITLEKAHQAINAGAQFVVTPNVDPEIIHLCLSGNIWITPGAFTPTEIVTAMSLGCRYIKLFPVRALGPAYIKDVLAPLSDARLLAVGGVDTKNIGDYIRAGAVGAGVGGSLCRVPLGGDFSLVTEEAISLLNAVRQAKGNAV
jgi:2-dehydro-3-deoxyphosphogluconate aldolase / (4S)-4-hydroxy-2-oxoglutarate aldolase